MLSYNELQGQYRQLRRDNFPTESVRDFVHQTLLYGIQEPSPQRQKIVERIFNGSHNGQRIISPQHYTGEDGIYIRKEDGHLLATQGKTIIELEDLCSADFKEDYNLPLKKAPDYVWVDTQEEILEDLGGFLAYVPHLVIQNLHLRFSPKKPPSSSFYHNILSHIGQQGHVYARNLTVSKSNDWITHKNLDSCVVDHPVRYAANAGIFYGTNLAFKNISSCLENLCSDKGAGFIAGLSIQQQRSGPYSLKLAATRNGSLFLQGPLHCPDAILQHAAQQGGQLRISAPESSLNICSPHNTTAICRTLHGNWNHSHGFRAYCNDSFAHITPATHYVIMGGDDVETISDYLARGEQIYGSTEAVPIPRHTYTEYHDTAKQATKESIILVKASLLDNIQGLSFEKAIQSLTEQS